MKRPATAAAGGAKAAGGKAGTKPKPKKRMKSTPVAAAGLAGAVAGSIKRAATLADPKRPPTGNAIRLQAAAAAAAKQPAAAAAGVTSLPLEGESPPKKLKAAGSI